MKKIRTISIFTFFAFLILGLNYSYGQGDVEVDGNLKINYTNGQSPATMLSLERFNPSTSSLCFFGGTIPASTNTWSLTLSDRKDFRCPFPFGGPFGGGTPASPAENYLDFNYDGTNVSSITHEGKHIRPETGTADLLPYAYGRIEASSDNVVPGTNNFTIVRKNYGVDIIFDAPIARQLVVNATPIQEFVNEVILLRTKKNLPGENATDIHIGYPTLNTAANNAQSTIQVYLKDSSGSTQKDASFSFIAYKPQ